MDQFWSAPPVTRTLTALTFAQSILVYGGLHNAYYVPFLTSLVFKFPPEVWRLGSSFLLTGPQLDFLFDLYFMFTYGSALETNSPRLNGPGDFFTYVFFVATVILLTAGCYLEGGIFTSALILAFVYTYAHHNKGMKTTFYFFQIRVEFLPWAMLVITMVRFGWRAALLESMGIVAAHMYEFLTRIYPAFGGGKNYITTPDFIRRFFIQTSRETYRSYGTTYRSTGQIPASQASEESRGWSSQNSWSRRGTGRRLGG
ncbi:centromere/microtubule-binding protein Cbf5, partial [Aspergillus ruber CBS 135680]